jgi:hypothetical protein
MGLTASEDSYTLKIFLSCSNIHYLLRVIYRSQTLGCPVHLLISVPYAYPGIRDMCTSVRHSATCQVQYMGSVSNECLVSSSKS